MKNALEAEEGSAIPLYDFSLIIACYHDAPHLIRNTLVLCDYLSSCRFSYEIVLVEDGSKDHTAQEVKKLAHIMQDQSIPCQTIFHSVNQGRGAAVSNGIRAAKGTIVGYIDIDLEPLLDSLLVLIRMVQRDEADVIVGRRVIANAIAKPIRVLSSYVYRWLAHLALPLPIADTECGLKVFHRAKILPILDQTTDKKWFWDTEIVHRAWKGGLRVTEHWIVFYEDRSKVSTVRLFADTLAYLKAIANYRNQIKF